MNPVNAGRTTAGSKALFITGLLLFLAGLIILLFTRFYIRALTHHSVWFLQRFYAPGRSEQLDYDQLFQYARDITNHRNALAVSLYSTVGILTVALDRKSVV